MPIAFRARALALLGGSFRLGMFVGMFVAALVIALPGDEASAAWCFVVCIIACMLLVGFGLDPETRLLRADAGRQLHGATEAADHPHGRSRTGCCAP